MKSTVRKWLFVVIYLQKDTLIQDDVYAAMFAVQASLVMCIVQEYGENCLLCVSLILDYDFCK